MHVTLNSAQCMYAIRTHVREASTYYAVLDAWDIYFFSLKFTYFWKQNSQLVCVHLCWHRFLLLCFAINYVLDIIDISRIEGSVFILSFLILIFQIFCSSAFVSCHLLIGTIVTSGFRWSWPILRNIYRHRFPIWIFNFILD